MGNLLNRIEKLEQAGAAKGSRIELILRPVIRPEDGAIIGILKTPLDGAGRRQIEITDPSELAELGFVNNPDGTYSKTQEDSKCH